MYIADMLSRAYLQVDRTQCKRTPEYQIFQLKQEQQLFEEIASINQVDYIAYLCVPISRLSNALLQTPLCRL